MSKLSNNLCLPQTPTLSRVRSIKILHQNVKSRALRYFASNKLLITNLQSTVATRPGLRYLSMGRCRENHLDKTTFFLLIIFIHIRVKSKRSESLTRVHVRASILRARRQRQQRAARRQHRARAAPHSAVCVSCTESAHLREDLDTVRDTLSQINAPIVIQLPLL